MSTIQVKPAPGLDPAAAKVLKHPASGGLLDAAGAVPPDGRPWLADGFTARMLSDGAIMRVEAGAPGFAAWAAEQLAAQKPAPSAPEPDPAH